MVDQGFVGDRWDPNVGHEVGVVVLVEGLYRDHGRLATMAKLGTGLVLEASDSAVVFNHGPGWIIWSWPLAAWRHPQQKMYVLVSHRCSDCGYIGIVKCLAKRFLQYWHWNC